MMEKDSVTVREQLEQNPCKDESTEESKDNFSNLAIVQQSNEDPFISHFLTKFKPTKILGQGSYGCVFEVDEHRNTLEKYKMAVKRIPIPGNVKDMQAASAYFTRKRLMIHPGIVKYYDAWFEKPPIGWQRLTDEDMRNNIIDGTGMWPPVLYKDDSAFFYVKMELCYSDLAKWLSTNKWRNDDTMIMWFKPIVSAVAYLHENGKIHRDLKPSNILFAGRDQLKICDLDDMSDRVMVDGDEGQELAMERTFAIGTVMYMAPEQMGYAEYSSKVDVFTLGLILAELNVFMETEQKKTVFDNYRMGKPNTFLDKCPEVNEVVTLLTNVNDTERPDCNTILKHPLLDFEARVSQRPHILLDKSMSE